MKTKVMLDLETLGQRPGCKILSIGAVVFSPDGLGPELEITIDPKTRPGLHMDVATVEWWVRQTDAARQALFSGLRSTLEDALGRLRGFIFVEASNGQPDEIEIWGNGADFDNTILAEAYHRLGMPTPWKFYNNRCYRTLKNLARQIEPPPRVGHHHKALDDAKAQALHAISILNHLNGWG